MAKVLRIISWILLTLVGVLTLLGAVGSAQFAISRSDDQFGDVTLSELTEGDTTVTNLIHGRRLTAAAFAAAYSALFLLVVLFPYRRGEVWSWWALLISTLVLSAIILLRIPFLGISLGASVAYSQLAVVVVALLLDIGRLKKQEK
jgi:hypothetical protein